MKFRLIMVVTILSLLIAISGISQAAPKQTLEVWIMQPGNMDGAKTFVDKLNAQFIKSHRGVGVNVSWIPWTGAQQKLITSIVGGIAPDICELGTTWTPDFAAMGALQEMDSYLAKVDFKSDLLPALLESATYDNVIYGLPWYGGNRAVFYRKDWFEEAGIKKFPTTWQEFAEAAVKLTKDTNNDGKIDRFGFAVNGASQHEFLPLIWMNKGEIAVKTEKGWKSAVDSPESREALRWFADLYLKHKVSPEGSITWNVLSGRKGFETGALAMYIDLAVLAPKYQDNPDLKGKFGIAQFPYSKQPSGFLGGSNLVMFSQSKKKALAWDYMKLMLSPEYQSAWGELVKFFPARASVLKEAKFANDPFLPVFIENSKYCRAYPVIPQWGQIENSKVLLKMMQQILMGKRTVEEATAEAAKTMNIILGYNED